MSANYSNCPQPSRCPCGERPRIYAFPCLWGNKSALCEYCEAQAEA